MGLLRSSGPLEIGLPPSSGSSSLNFLLLESLDFLPSEPLLRFFSFFAFLPFLRSRGDSSWKEVCSAGGLFSWASGGTKSVYGS